MRSTLWVLVVVSSELSVPVAAAADADALESCGFNKGDWREEVPRREDVYFQVHEELNYLEQVQFIVLYKKYNVGKLFPWCMLKDDPRLVSSVRRLLLVRPPEEGEGGLVLPKKGSMSVIFNGIESTLNRVNGQCGQPMVVDRYIV